MAIKKTLKMICDFCIQLFFQEDGPSIPPVQYRGYAKDYEALERDRQKLSGDKQGAKNKEDFSAQGAQGAQSAQGAQGAQGAEGAESSVAPLRYRGFARDYMALCGDASKVGGDMQRGWEKTKARYDLEAQLN